MQFTIFYYQPPTREDSIPAFEPVIGEFASVAEAKAQAMLEVGPKGKRGHVAAFEIKGESPTVVASWKRDPNA